MSLRRKSGAGYRALRVVICILAVVVAAVGGWWLSRSKGNPATSLSSSAAAPASPSSRESVDPSHLGKGRMAAEVVPADSDLSREDPPTASLQSLQSHLRTRRSTGAELRCWVRSEDGIALIGGVATLYRADSDASGDESVIASARTDQNGFFSLALEQPPGQVRLTLEHGTHVGLRDFLELNHGSTVERTYKLEKGRAELEGRVVSQSRLPIPGVLVQVSRTLLFNAVRTEAVFQKPVTTDYRGRFQLSNLPTGEISLTFLARGYFVSGTEVTLSPGKNPPITHRLEQGASHVLRVVDPEGQPIYPAMLRTAELHPYSSDPDGWIDFLLPAGLERVNVELSAPGYLARTVEFDPGAKRTDEVLQLGQPFAGVVVSPTGNPVSNAQVVVSGAGHHYEGAVVTGPDGSFELALSRPPVSSVGVTHPQAVETRIDLTADSANFVEIRVELPEAGLYGQLMSSAGHPLELFTIRLADQQGRRYSRHFRNSRGYFEILDIRQGTYSLEATSQDLVEQQGTLRREGIVLSRGQVLGPIRLQFQE